MYDEASTFEQELGTQKEGNDFFKKQATSKHLRQDALSLCFRTQNLAEHVVPCANHAGKLLKGNGPARDQYKRSQQIGV